MQYHILTGDALATQFNQTQLDGEILVSRECLIEGPTQASSLQAFWEMRSNYIQETYNGTEQEYFDRVVGEYQQLLHFPAGTEVNLWFEYDLFCQVNMWFCLWLLRQSNKPLKVFRVFPVTRQQHDRWLGFGKLDPQELKRCFQYRVPFSEEAIFVGAQLWQAYSQNNMTKLRKLALNASPCFPYLAEVCEAQIERLNGRLEKTLRNILEEGVTDFKDIFTRFFSREGIYGLGDLQVKKLYEQVR
ncbi:MAG: DUF1835 domain-containing protein [Saprospiraceae bacterium]